MPGFLESVDKFFLNNKTVAAVLIAACFFVYANSLTNSFMWDDEEKVILLKN